ncbi:hypothetical protein CMEL01_08038 [Colletotrichum melonis]|uniref:Uncharacterized protein n=1 Tax=Colletotrichum melonis TaxID=1209925 RepID=A0AAI9TZC9_9PEZI|nr:hypothetical protein CMEL01_08038 [Colletotrichum melonis]
MSPNMDMTTIGALMTERQANDFMAFHDDITAWQNTRNHYRISGKEVPPAIAAVTSGSKPNLRKQSGPYTTAAFEQFTRKEALYGGLIMELRQILRDHNLMKDLHCSVERLPELCVKHDMKGITHQEVEDAQDQQGWRAATNWSDLIREVDRELRCTAEWNHCYGRYEERGWRSTPFECPPKPKTPFLNVARAVIDLCLDEVSEEDNCEPVVDIVREQITTPNDFSPWTI